MVFTESTSKIAPLTASISINMNNWHEIRTPAKINLFFELLGKRPDGYHDVSTVVGLTDFTDTVRARAICSQTQRTCPESNPNGIILRCSTNEAIFAPLRLAGAEESLYVPSNEQNLVYKAAALLKEKYKIEQGIEIEVEKSIPPQSGLGGGSSNAAGALKVCAEVWNLSLTTSEYRELGAQLGSDVPLFFSPGASLATGRGEIITPVLQNARYPIVIIRPAEGISTPAVYRRCRIPEVPQSADSLIQSMKEKNQDLFYSQIFNRLESYAAELTPFVNQAQSAIMQTRARGGCLCGSGSCYFGIYDSPEAADYAVEKLKKQAWPMVIRATVIL